MRRTNVAVAAVAGWALAVTGVLPVSANVTLRQVSTDTYTNTTSQHKTQAEPDSFSSGSTEVAAFQSGLFFTGGASNIGWATTTNNGSTWTHGFLPNTTTLSGGPWARVGDPSVAFDAKHNTWMITSLAIDSTATGKAVLVSRSTNGGTVWTSPVTVTQPGGSAILDKERIACDGTASSPHYGNCYAEWDDANNGSLAYMSTSTDGGSTWGAPKNTGNHFPGIGGRPVVQPNGTVVVPIEYPALTALLEAFISADGGATWTAPVVIATVTNHHAGGSLRNSTLPSAGVDSGGTVYVAWESCQLEPSCASNDILISSSANGVSWSNPAKVIGGGGVDYLLPGLGVDHPTGGGTAHLGMDYYSELASCTSNCSLKVGFVSSANGGSTWGAGLQLAGPINTTWLANTNQGRMVGDYNSTSFLNGKAYPVFAVATKPVGTKFNESMNTPAAGVS